MSNMPPGRGPDRGTAILLVARGRQIDARVANAPPHEHREGGGEMLVRIDGREIRLRLERLEPTAWRIIGDDGVARVARTAAHAGTLWLHLDGETVAVQIGGRTETRGAARRRGRAEGLEAPMPGAVTQVGVREGEHVAVGQPIVVVEAMKMEHVIRSPHAGRVIALRVRQGQQVEAGTIVAEIQPLDGTASGGGGDA